MSSTPSSSSCAAVDTAESLDHPAAAVGAAAAAETDDDTTGARRPRRRDQLPHAPAVRVERGLHRRRTAEQRQTTCLRALDVGGDRRV